MDPRLGQFSIGVLVQKLPEIYDTMIYHASNLQERMKMHETEHLQTY